VSTAALDDLLDQRIVDADDIDDALDELEEKLAAIHRQYLWDGACDPETGKMSQRQRTAMQRAHGVRQAAMLLERLRIDGFA
jgi:hypothetical protein